MATETRKVLKEILSQIDINSTDTAPLEHSKGVAEILDHENRQKLISLLKEHYSENDVKEVCRLSHSWKEGSYCDDGQTLEMIHNSIDDIGCPVRNGELSGRPPNEDEVKICNILCSITNKYVESEITGAPVAYRGINTYDGLVSAVIDVLDPGTTEAELEFTKLCNFTLDRDTADYHGLVIAQLELDPEDAALAADFFLPYPENGSSRVPEPDRINKNESEIRVHGDPLVIALGQNERSGRKLAG